MSSCRWRAVSLALCVCDGVHCIYIIHIFLNFHTYRYILWMWWAAAKWDYLNWSQQNADHTFPIQMNTSGLLTVRVFMYMLHAQLESNWLDNKNRNLPFFKWSSSVDVMLFHHWGVWCVCARCAIHNCTKPIDNWQLNFKRHILWPDSP